MHARLILQLMEFFVLLALVLLSLLLLRRRSYTTRAPAAAVAIQKISDAALAHRVLVENANVFSNRPVAPFQVALANSSGGQFGQSLSTVPYGPHWRALRCNLTAETLHPSRLADLAPLQRDAIQALVAGLSAAAAAGAGAVAVRDHLDAAVFSVVARLCFGDDLCVDGRRVSAMRRAVRGFQQAAAGGIEAAHDSMLAKLTEWRQMRRLLAFHGRMGELFLPLVAARRQQRRLCHGHDRRRPYVDSLIDLRVLEGSNDGCPRALRSDEIVNLLSEFLGAGTGTVVACLEWALAHLVAQPEAQEKLRREVDGEADAVSCNRSELIRRMPYLHAVVLESLRMHPPVAFALRHVEVHVSTACVLGVGGTTAPAVSDLIVQFVLGDIGRDSKAWQRPDEFRPERFLAGGEAEGVGLLLGRKETRMMPFGAGNRFCPGVGTAMMNVKCVLAALVRQFEWAPPTDDAVVDLTELDGFLKTMKKPLSARLTRRT